MPMVFASFSAIDKGLQTTSENTLKVVNGLDE
jgi:hypothetical protein